MTTEKTARITWHQQDVEQKFGFRGGRFTRVNGFFCALVGLVVSVLFYMAIVPLEGQFFSDKFTKRGLVPYAVVFFSSVSLAIVFVKWRKLRFQKRLLSAEIVPPDLDFVLSVATVEDVVAAMYGHVDDLKQFVLFNRIHIALSNLKNLGRVTDVDEILRSQAEQDESVMETSYSLLKGLIWAIPVLGFIGTVLGLSEAIGNFGAVLENSDDISQITGSLQAVTGGLATAFDTTLLALTAALGIQCVITVLKQAEEEFLDDCSEYCQGKIVAKLRIMPFQDDNANA